MLRRRDSARASTVGAFSDCVGEGKVRWTAGEPLAALLEGVADAATDADERYVTPLRGYFSLYQPADHSKIGEVLMSMRLVPLELPIPQRGMINHRLEGAADAAAAAGATVTRRVLVSRTMTNHRLQ